MTYTPDASTRVVVTTFSDWRMEVPEPEATRRMVYTKAAGIRLVYGDRGLIVAGTLPSDPILEYPVVDPPKEDPWVSALIDHLPGELRVTRPIPVTFEEDAGGWTAWFKDADIGMSGDTMAEARELLAEDIADAYVLFSGESGNLGPGPASQLKALRRYISDE